MKLYKDSTYQISDSANSSWPFASMGSEGKFGVSSTIRWGANATYFVQKGSKDSLFFWPMRINKDTLEISGFCIEGCIYRFRKIK